MAGFDHVNTPSGPAEASDPRATKFGRVLFAFYTLLYGAFVLLNAFAPAVMQRELGGISVAVWYGLVLIAAAFALALLYDWVCRWLMKSPPTNSEGDP